MQQNQETEIRWKPTRKQRQAINLLRDDKTTEVFYGGGAGGGKSYLGCVWVLSMCLTYAGCRALMGRAVLKSLKESTLLTFFEVARSWGLRKDQHYKYNSIEGIIKFPNGSEIYLKDLATYPSDPEFDRLGSTEYTIEFIDEGSQISEKCKNILMSRLRYKLDEFKIIPKLLIASNPSKNFLYYQFYKPWKEGTLDPHRAFIPALVMDNPFISQHYIDNLHKLDKVSKQRLLFGNFEYDDDPSKLFDYDKILDVFNTKGKPGQKYLSIDVARLGADKVTVFVWNGWHIEKVIWWQKKKTDETERRIETIKDQEQVPWSNIIIDEDGIGGGVVDHLPGTKGFLNGGSPLEISRPKGTEKIHSYRNLKSQCYFYLADMVEKGLIGCGDVESEVREKLIEDLEQIKRKNADKDGPLEVVGKDEIKKQLGRSTDFSDAMMMRMIFEIRPQVINVRYG